MAMHLIITGVVQGVGYRASFERKARALGLSGWVRNRLDGSVEALVHGDAGALGQITEWARRGPPAARVKEVLVKNVEDFTPGDRNDPEFRVLPTA